MRRLLSPCEPRCSFCREKRLRRGCFLVLVRGFSCFLFSIWCSDAGSENASLVFRIWLRETSESVRRLALVARGGSLRFSLSTVRIGFLCSPDPRNDEWQ